MKREPTIMDLKDFIKSTLTQIVQAVEESNEALKESDAEINPTVWSEHGGLRIYKGKDAKTFAEMIEFDVAVTAREEKGNTGGAAVTIAAIGLGTKRTSENENTTVSRIKFKIPVLLPQHKVVK